MNKDSYRPVEMQINLKDVIWGILSQWKLLLIIAILMSSMLAGIKYAKDTKAYLVREEKTAAEEKAGLSSEEKIEKILSELSPSERRTVEYIVRQSEWLEAEKEYVSNSILFNTDPTNQRTLITNYFISTRDDAGTSVSSLAYGYCNYINNDEIVDSIGKIISPDAEEKYIAELIKCSNTLDDNISTVSDVGALIEVRIILPEECDAQAVESALTNKLKDFSSYLDKTIGPHDITIIGSSEAYLYNEYLVNSRNNVLYSIYNLSNNTKNMQSAMSETENKAVEQVELIKKEDKEGADEGFNNNSVISEEEQETRPTFSKRYALLGFVFGVIMYSMVYMIIIIMRGSVASASDVQLYTGNRLLGEIYYNTESHGLNRLIHSVIVNRLRYRDRLDIDEQIDRIKDSMGAVCAHADAKELTVYDLTEHGDDTTSALLNRAVDCGIKTNTVAVAKALDEKSFLDIENAVLVIDNGTKIDKIAKLRTLLIDYSINNLGTIYIEGL